MELEEDDGDEYFSDEEDGDDGEDVERGEAQGAATCEGGEEGFGDLIEAGGAAAGGKVQAALAEAGEEIAGHGEGADQNAERPCDAEDECADSCDDDGNDEAAQGFRRAEERVVVGQDETAIDGVGPAPAKDAIEKDGRSVGAGEQGEKLEDDPSVQVSPPGESGRCMTGEDVAT